METRAEVPASRPHRAEVPAKPEVQPRLPPQPPPGAPGAPNGPPREGEETVPLPPPPEPPSQAQVPTGRPAQVPSQQSPAGGSPLDAALERLVSGNIAFNTPDRIPLGKSKIIEAKLSINLPPKVLLDQLGEAGAKESASIKVADRMIATLTGGGAFDVSPSGPQQQLISNQQVTTWTWVVTPKQPGSQFLILSFDADNRW